MRAQKKRKYPFRRRKEGKTDYKKRLALLKSRTPRLVARKLSNTIIAQIVEYTEKGDKVIQGVTSKNLKAYGWKAGTKNTPAAYLTGLLCGTKAGKELGRVVLDIGLATPVHGSIPFTVLKGAIDSGLDIKADEKVFPAQERIEGKHIADYASKLSEEEKKKKYGEYYKKGLDPKDLTKHFNEVKQNIIAGKEVEKK